MSGTFSRSRLKCPRSASSTNRSDVIFVNNLNGIGECSGQTTKSHTTAVEGTNKETLGDEATATLDEFPTHDGRSGGKMQTGFTSVKKVKINGTKIPEVND